MCRDDEIIWTEHVIHRLDERNFTKEDIVSCIMRGEIIEQYPMAFPLPSCLILGAAVTDELIHVVAAVGGFKVHIVTTYHINTNAWESDMKTRKKGE